MIGRGSIGYPWIFNEINCYIKNGILPPPPTIKERINVVKEHLDLSIKWKGEKVEYSGDEASLQTTLKDIKG